MQEGAQHDKLCTCSTSRAAGRQADPVGTRTSNATAAPSACGASGPAAGQHAVSRGSCTHARDGGATAGKCCAYVALAAPKCSMSARYKCTNSVSCHDSPRRASSARECARVSERGSHVAAFDADLAPYLGELGNEDPIYGCQIGSKYPIGLARTPCARLGMLPRWQAPLVAWECICSARRPRRRAADLV
jgi:hypothetical protein